jgi:hypothetical protein
VKIKKPRSNLNRFFENILALMKMLMNKMIQHNTVGNPDTDSGIVRAHENEPRSGVNDIDK